MGGLLSKKAKAKYRRIGELIAIALAPAFVDMGSKFVRGDDWNLALSPFIIIPFIGYLVASVVNGLRQSPSDYADKVVSGGAKP